MATREEIREGIEKFVSEAYWYEGEKNMVVDITSRLVNYLHSQGVVIKVDRELPLNKMTCNMKIIGEPEATKQVQDEIRREMAIWEEVQRDILQAGYVAVEPLI